MIKTDFYKKGIILFFSTYLSGCTMMSESIGTNHPNDACKMLKQNPDWLDASLASYDKWGTPVSIQLAFIRQESSFKHDARPIRKNKWHEFGTNYQSSAFGYAQAIDSTWDLYKKNTDSVFNRRDSFKDAVDFIGWYNYNSRKKLGLSKTDTYSLYLAYHEGWNGFNRKTYKKKKWLMDTSQKVNRWALKYSKQLNNCHFKRS